MIVRLNPFEFRFLGHGGVHWPATRTLFVADLHLGKEATFCANGLAVPQGATAGTLRMIAGMIDQTAIERLVILGDLFHAKSSLTESVCHAFTQFLAQHRALTVMLVVGNHDIATGPLARDWAIEVLPSPSAVDGLTFAHFPGPPVASTELCLAGHLHPAVRPTGTAMPIGKLPCFYFNARQSCLTLPAIGQFTGTAIVKPGGDDRTWVLADGEVIELPIGRARHSAVKR